MQSYGHKMLWLSRQAAIKEYKIDGLKYYKIQKDVTSAVQILKIAIHAIHSIHVLKMACGQKQTTFRTKVFKPNKGLVRIILLD